jgi:hypothetical protein
MKTTQKTKKYRSITIAAIVSAIILASSSYYVFALNGNIFGWRINQTTNSQNTTDNEDIDISTPATEDQIDTGQIIKDNTIKDSQTKPEPSNQIQINASAVQNTSGLHISTIIQTSTSSGSCKLQLAKDTKVITKEASVQALSSYSTCKGFDIPSQDLESGTWTMSIIFTNGEKTGTTTSEIVLK